MSAVDADRNLLFGVLALQGELIEPGQFAEICSAWSVRKEGSIADLLCERGWITADDRSLLDQLLERRLKKHSGDVHKSLVAAMSADARALATLHGLADQDVRRTLAEVTSVVRHSNTIDYLSRIDRSPETRDRYTLTSLHAQGGIGQVWLARDNDMDREVALKELRPERSDDKSILQRFLQEARITGGLDHPGVVPVYELARGEAAQEGAHPYYTMRFIRGRTLSEAVADYHHKVADKTAGRTDLLLLLQAFVGVANTVAFAHSRRVIHRDLKGSNIILGEFGEVVLLDWGLAKIVDRGDRHEQNGPDFDPDATTPSSEPVDLAGSDLTVAGQVMGTPAYMAPEQAEGLTREVGYRTDVYGLGAILYEILAGKPPFAGGSIHEVLRKVREEPPPRPSSLCGSAPRPLEAVSLKAMAKNPGARYGSAAELAADVQHWLVDEPVSAWREPLTVRARRWMVRHRTKLAASVAALAAAVIGLTGALAIQARSNRDLQAALKRERAALADASFQSNQAEKAINSLYTGITEDVILRRPELDQLRGRLLGAALKFYDDRVEYLSKERLPTGISAVGNIAHGLDRIASLQALLGDRESAIRTRHRVVKLLEENPDLGTNRLGDALHSLGELQRLAGRPRDAVESLRKALDECDRGDYDSKGALAESDLGRLLFDIGENTEARQLLDRARGTQERVQGFSPRPLIKLGELANTYTTLANLHAAEGRPAEALNLYEKAVASYQELIAKTRNSAYISSELARTLNNLGLARAVAGNVVEGLRDVEQGKEIRERLLSNLPLSIDYRADLARSYYHASRIHFLMGAMDKASDSIRKAEELYAGIPPKAPEDIYFRAGMKALQAALVKDGKPDSKSAPSSVPAARQQLADQAMELLKQAVKAGYANPSRFKNDRPLDSLRSRPDFQELLQSIGRPAL